MFALLLTLCVGSEVRTPVPPDPKLTVEYLTQTIWSGKYQEGRMVGFVRFWVDPVTQQGRFEQVFWVSEVTEYHTSRYTQVWTGNWEINPKTGKLDCHEDIKGSDAQYHYSFDLLTKSGPNLYCKSAAGSSIDLRPEPTKETKN